MKIAIVHYHLQPGGVTRVIENTLQAWEENGQTVEAVALSGRPYPGDQLTNTQVVDGLDYATPSEAINPQILANRLLEAAKSGLGKRPDIWHIHNHSLGKNPSLTEAVAILAESGESMLLHPHDFAEDGRPGKSAEPGRGRPAKGFSNYKAVVRGGHGHPKTAAAPEGPGRPAGGRVVPTGAVGAGEGRR